MQIAFYKGRKRLFNRLVSWWLRGPYSHCELVLQQCPNGDAFCASSSYLDGGVRVKPIALDPEHWDVVEVGGSVAQAYEWLGQHRGQGYDVLGLLGFLWRRESGMQNKWFCSEAIAAMLGYQDPQRFDPMTLWACVSAPQTPNPTETH